MKLTEIYEAVVGASSHVHLSEVEMAVSMECCKFYNADQTQLDANKSVKKNGLKSGDKLGILVEPYVINAVVDIQMEEVNEENIDEHPPAEEKHYEQVQPSSSEPTKKCVAENIQSILLDKIDGLYFAGGAWVENLMRGNKNSLIDVEWGILHLVEKLEKAEDEIAALKASIT